MKFLAIVPARKGSKTIKNKNLKKFNKKPLIYWTIKSAIESGCFDKIMISTDSIQIQKYSKKFKVECPYLRNKKLSGDKSNMHDVILDVVKYCEKNNYYPDAIVLLQPTSPFRSIKTFKTALTKFKKNTKLPLVTIKKLSLSSNKFFIKKNNLIKTYKPSKKAVDVFVPNGSIFIIDKKILKKNRSFLSDKMNYILNKSVKEDLDIDTQNDLYLAKKIFS